MATREALRAGRKLNYLKVALAEFLPALEQPGYGESRRLLLAVASAAIKVGEVRERGRYRKEMS